MLIVTLDDCKATEDVATAMRQVHPDVTILVRGHNAEQCHKLRKLGASLAVSENLEASLDLAREALILDEVDAAGAESLILQFRDDHYAGAGDRKPDARSGLLLVSPLSPPAPQSAGIAR